MKAQKLDILAIAGPSWTGDTYADNRPLPSWHSTQWHEAMTEGSRDKVCCRVWSAPGRAVCLPAKRRLRKQSRWSGDDESE